MKAKKAVFFSVVVLLAAILLLTSNALTNVTKTVPSSGTIVTSANVGVYFDSACTQPLSSIAWGNVTVGGTATYQCWVKNTGSANITLNMATNGWSPVNASQYITLSWNQNNTILTPNQVANTTLTLAVSSTIAPSITSFSNNITVTGTG